MSGDGFTIRHIDSCDACHERLSHHWIVVGGELPTKFGLCHECLDDLNDGVTLTVDPVDPRVRSAREGGAQ